LVHLLQRTADFDLLGPQTSSDVKENRRKATSRGRTDHLPAGITYLSLSVLVDASPTLPDFSYAGFVGNISYILCKYDENRSSNPIDYERNKWTCLDETAKIGLSHRISHQLLDRSSPTFQRW